VPTPRIHAVIELAFDPTVRGEGFAVRLETVALAITILVAILLAVRIAHVMPGALRRDDLLFVVLGIIPGAVVGGRLGYALVHLDYFGAHASALIDPAVGSLQLSLAVIGGLLTGWLIASLLDTPSGRWLHVATLPLLFALGTGKLVQALGGDGQGVPAAVPWATAYLGDGPWGSLAPEIPSHPAQVYEALGTALVALVIIGLLASGWFRARDGRVFFLALGLWGGMRFVVAFTWRDAAVAGPLNVDQLLSLLVVLVAAGGSAVAPRLLRRSPAGDEPHPPEAQTQWPDPASRPPF
jgi:prolipoprotein diacylglyceryltransferase